VAALVALWQVQGSMAGAEVSASEEGSEADGSHEEGSDSEEVSVGGSEDVSAPATYLPVELPWTRCVIVVVSPSQGSDSGSELVEDDQDGSEDLSDEAEGSHGYDGGSGDSGEDF
jgi:hypothetical protein